MGPSRPASLATSEKGAAGLALTPWANKAARPPRLEQRRLASFLCTIVPLERYQGHARLKLNAIHRHDKASFSNLRLQNTPSYSQDLRLG